MDWLGRMLRNRRAGELSLVWYRPGFDAPSTITLVSAAFVDGEPMPQRHAGKGVGDNVSPPLAWDGVPEHASELVIVVEDPDVPLRTPIVHAVAAGIPARETGVAPGALNGGERHGDGVASFGRGGYHGPRPIPGHGPHRYVFQVFALASPLLVPPGAKPVEVFALMDGCVIARGRLTGTYER